VAEEEGELVGQGAVCEGPGRGEEGKVHSLALGALLSRADVLPPASPGQVRDLLLEAAMEHQPAVLVPQGKCQELLHEEAGTRGADGVDGPERRGAGGQETVRWCMLRNLVKEATALCWQALVG
jgi:hypothetical protein